MDPKLSSDSLLFLRKLLKFWGWRGGRVGGVFEHQCKLLKFVRNKTLSVNFSLDYENNQVSFKDEANFRDAVQ